ncbi:hypothetical protein EDC94DRAFT_581201 [Helicostylum pulchrum]|nr:hypothetical protein EDC94DRAFT_581201 [Helicostylum pulchrum]
MKLSLFGALNWHLLHLQRPRLPPLLRSTSDYICAVLSYFPPLAWRLPQTSSLPYNFGSLLLRFPTTNHILVPSSNDNSDKQASGSSRSELPPATSWFVLKCWVLKKLFLQNPIV